VPVSSYHYLEGPLIAMAALGLIVLICRWVFSTGHRASTVAPVTSVQARDFGLLQSVCTVRTHDDAMMLQALLREAGIRSTVSPSREMYDVLVFSGDAVRAKDLVRS